MGKLTAIAVKAVSKPGRYQDGNGLQLFVKKSGAKFWVLRIQAGGKRRDIGLGSAASVALREARDKAAEFRKSYQRGADPLAERRAAKLATAAIPTFREAARIAHSEHKGGWRNVKHRADWLSSLERYAFALVGDMRVDLIDAPTVRDILLPIWLDQPETARRVRQRVKLVIDWATVKGYRSPLDLSGVTKALPRQPKSDSHFKAMLYEQVPAFVASLKASGDTLSRMALQCLILTAARFGIGRRMRSEMSLLDISYARQANSRKVLQCQDSWLPRPDQLQSQGFRLRAQTVRRASTRRTIVRLRPILPDRGSAGDRPRIASSKIAQATLSERNSGR
jgi:Arm DNA-binding domain